jgi:hypothetical protein
MPIDETIEALSNSIFKFILWVFPSSVLLGALNIYTTIIAHINLFYEQMCKTIDAVKCSFDSPVLAFFKYGATHVPMPIHENTRYSMLPSWIYTVQTKEFTIPNTEQIQMRGAHLPYISAVLVHKIGSTETILGDLSEWLGDQIVYAPEGSIPLQVLVATWLYINTPPTLLMNYNNLYLKTMNESAEECTYAVETEQPVEEGELVGGLGGESNAATTSAPSEA